MKKLMVFLSLAVSLLVFSAQGMNVQSPSSDPIVQAVSGNVLNSQPSVVQPQLTTAPQPPTLEQIKQASYEGALKAQPTFLGGVAKKAGCGVLICIAGYLVLRYVIGMPSLAHVKKEVNGFLVSTKNGINKTFGAIRTSLVGLTNNFADMIKRSKDANIKIVELGNNVKQQNKDLKKVDEDIKALNQLAGQCEDLDKELSEEIINLIKAICNRIGKDKLLKKLDSLVEQKAQGYEKLAKLKTLIENIN